MPRASLRLTDDQMCFGCGSRNSRGLKLQFDLDLKRRRIKTRWIPSKTFQGYADILHGGMVGLVLDELMGNLLWKMKMPSVTVEMTVQFLRPTRVGSALECEAWMASQKGSLCQMQAEAKTPRGKIVAKAHARFVQIKNPRVGSSGA